MRKNINIGFGSFGGIAKLQSKSIKSSYLLLLDANELRDFILLHSGFHIVPSDCQQYYVLYYNKAVSSIPKNQKQLYLFGYNQDYNTFFTHIASLSQLESIILSVNCFVNHSTRVSFNGIKTVS